jgi:hypothetical protein
VGFATIAPLLKLKLKASEADAMQGAWRAATEKMSEANFGGDLPLGYVEATFLKHFEGSEHHATPQCAATAAFREPVT